MAEPSARGAGLNQVIGLSIAAVVIAAVMLGVGHGHRTRRIAWLREVAETTARRFNRPSWVALQVLVFVTSIICALFGFIWDVSWHIGNGRDPGPLANPAHYFIIVGLFGIFVAGILAVVAPYGQPGSAAVRITRHWYAPVGGILLAGCGMYAMTGFPLDDIWHRIFGQDVTLWGPTHLMMIGGACFSLFALLMLEYEGRRSMPADREPDSRFVTFLRYLSFGGLLIGLSVYQIEYDFGVEQFRLVLQPMMIAGAAALALVAARLTLGSGAALIAALLAAGLRGMVALLVGPILGGPISWFPLYLGPAVVVELIALTPLIRRPIAFGAIAGVAVGTVGIWAESWWIAAVYHYPWPTSMWRETLATAPAVAALTGLCGALFAMVLTGQKLPRRSVSLSVAVGAVVVIGGAVANGLHTVVPPRALATITLTELPSPPGQRMVSADVLITPTNLIGPQPDWATILAWQGQMVHDRGLLIDQLQHVGPGHYRSTRPLPVWGSWKTLLRVQDGDTMSGVPIYEPKDAAIPAPEIPAVAHVARPFGPEITILQRERDQNAPEWLFTAGSLVALFLSLTVIAALTWAAGRINNAPPEFDHVDEPQTQPGRRGHTRLPR